jgi:hypothetical protein
MFRGILSAKNCYFDSVKGMEDHLIPDAIELKRQVRA